VDSAREVRLDRGTVVLLSLDPTVGHEQRGVRPCVVVSDADVIADQRFPLVAVVPVTATPGEGALYPVLRPGSSGLAKTCYALIDHLRSVDKRRIRRVFGAITTAELDAIDEGLVLFLGLGAKPGPLPAQPYG
jgi:mRNA-degrading endonuclease toxin of MazEF toxin-antitoxin module